VRFTRIHVFLLVGGILVLLGPTTALTQQGGGPRGGPGGGQRGGPGGGQWNGGAPDAGGPGGGFGGQRQRGGFGGPPGGGGPGNMDPKQMAGMMFTRLSNNKGFVTIDDIVNMSQGRDPTARENVEQFMQSQGINNGQLTQDQFAAYFEQRSMQRRNSGQGPSRNPANDDINAERDFQQLDKNHDGQLDTSEMSPELKEEWQKWDLNHDGMINLDEYKAFYKARMAAIRGDNPDSQGWNGLFPGQPDEQPEEKRHTVYRLGNLPKDLPAWFVQYDTDHDGQIGLYEWRATGRPIEEFRAMDLNGDGFLTMEEVLRYQKALAKKDTLGGSDNAALADAGGGFPGAGFPMAGFPGAGFPGGFPGGNRGGNWGGPGGNPVIMPGNGGPGGRGGRGDRGGDPNAAGDRGGRKPKGG
jgi:Ca2+-binding EF-hand superfamily protein